MGATEQYTDPSCAPPSQMSVMVFGYKICVCVRTNCYLK